MASRLMHLGSGRGRREHDASPSPQIQKAALNGDIGDVGAPDLIGTVDHEPVQKIRINPVRRMRITGSRRLIDEARADEGAVANKNARIAWAVLARGETYRAPKAA